MSTQQYIAIFENARAVIRAEKACRLAGITAKVMPLPEKYSSECGMSLLLNEAQLEPFTTIIKQLSIYAKIENYE